MRGWHDVPPGDANVEWMRATNPDRMRREPRQGRSRQTVDAVLGAVPRVIRREGVDVLTTNRIAEAAGVSIVRAIASPISTSS